MPYIALMNESTQYGKDAPITYDDFDSGYTIFSFNTTTSHGQYINEEYSEPEEGSLELSCVFDTSPKVPIVFVVVCYFPSILAIDSARKFQISNASSRTMIRA